MKKKILPFSSVIISLYFSLSTSLFAQISINTGLTPQQLVQNVLLGPGVQVSNISFSGDPLQIGSFSGNSSVGISSGILMASGDVNVAAGPNNSSGSTMTVINFNTDNDLNIIAGFQINDPSILQFDFIPTGDTVRFKYVFSSEEYLEFVGSYNDAFGFFISGPGISGPYSNNAKNIALIPGTSTPVTINNVNDAVNSAYYVNNGDGSTAPYDTDPFYVQFDGLTVVLEAVQAVQCGQTYHIKLAIGDALDNALESGVFLQAGSFSSNGVVVSVVTATGDSSIVEGCADATFSFTRIDTIGDLTIHYQIGGNAVNGSDYAFIPDSVTLLQGQTTTNLIVSPLDDSLAEGIDTMTITIYNITECGDTLIEEASLLILENYTILVNAANATSTCPGDSITLTAIASDGVAPYYYQWSNGASGNTTMVAPIATDTFYVTVTDSCSISATIDTVIVTMIINPVQLNISNDTVLYCPGDTVLLSAQASSGSGNGYQYAWSTGSGGNMVSVYPVADTIFYVTVTDGCGADSATDSVVVTFTIPQLNLSLSNDTVVECPGNTATLNATGGGGTVPYSYDWSNGNSTAVNVVNPNENSTYYVTLTDACGAAPVTDSIKVNIQAFPPLDINLSGDTSVICSGDMVLLSSVITGGASPYTYSWSTGANNSTINVSPLNTIKYFLTVTDKCGRDTIDSVMVTVPVYPPLLPLAEDNAVDCPGDSQTVFSTPAGGTGTGYTFLWSTGSTNDTILVSPPGIAEYFVTVTDDCGTMAADSAVLTVPVFQTINVIASDHDTVCTGDTIILNATAGGGGGTYAFAWSGTGSVFVVFNQMQSVPLSSGNYNVTVTDQCGNAETDNTWINIEDCKIVIPNIFTPNGDGLNQYFFVQNLEKNYPASLVIFNRWGIKIYENADYKNDWNGENVSDGVYFYILTTANGVNYNGTVTIVK